MALTASPFMAIFGITPVYIFHEANFSQFLRGVFFLTFLSFLIWFINVRIVMVYQKISSRQGKVISYIFVLILVAIFFHLGNYIFGFLEVEKPPTDIFYPILFLTAINTIIHIIIDSVLTKDKKDKAELKIQSLKIENMEAQQSLLLQQFQPHFLFNALSTLKSLMNTDVEEAEEYLLKLSNFLRFSVEIKNKSVITLEKELAFTQYYLDMQQIRFEGALFCKIEVGTELTKIKIVVFALQSLVENAIKHNGFSIENPLYIDIGHIEDVRYLYVKNNKIPKTILDSTKTGLQALNKRHEMIMGEPIEIVDTENEFKVILKLIK